MGSDLYSMDSSNAAGGGFSSFSLPSYDGLPPQPGSFEDFEYSFSYQPYDPEDYFASSSNPFLSASNPFSPSADTPLSPTSYYHTSLHSPPGTNDAPSFPTPPPPPDLSPAPLFDTNESALFSSFLNGIDIDQGFLFNPVLPPGMPSPPPALLPREDERERERLGQGFMNISIGRGVAAGGRNGSADAVKTEEEQDESLGGAAEGEEAEGRHPRDEREEEDRERVGVRTRGAAGGQNGRGSGKKVKVDESSNSDVEMAIGSDYDDDESTATSARRRRASRSNGNGGGATVRWSSTVRQRGSSYAVSTRTARQVAAAQGGRQQPPPTNHHSEHQHQQPPPPPRSPSPSPSLSASPDDDADLYGSTSSPHLGGAGGSRSGDKKVPLTESQKRSNHILSEQKRRNAIRSGFKDLVDLLANGEAASGIVVAPPEAVAEAGLAGGGGGGGTTGTGGKKKKAGKAPGRGRGRRGEAGAGASKSVVLDKAASYIMWLERGNEGLEKEVRRVEGLLGKLEVAAPRA